MKMAITAAVEYLCQRSLEATSVTKTKATKNEAILSNDEISSLDMKEVVSRETALQPEK